MAQSCCCCCSPAACPPSWRPMLLPCTVLCSRRRRVATDEARGSDRQRTARWGETALQSQQQQRADEQVRRSRCRCLNRTCSHRPGNSQVWEDKSQKSSSRRRTLSARSSLPESSARNDHMLPSSLQDQRLATSTPTVPSTDLKPSVKLRALTLDLVRRTQSTTPRPGLMAG